MVETGIQTDIRYPPLAVEYQLQRSSLEPRQLDIAPHCHARGGHEHAVEMKARHVAFIGESPGIEVIVEVRRNIGQYAPDAGILSCHLYLLLVHHLVGFSLHESQYDKGSWSIPDRNCCFPNLLPLASAFLLQ